ncbi:MAG: GNAT family N-acetyltransferase [Pseudomonadota bacterium]
MLREAKPDDAAVLARLHRASRDAAMPWLPVVHTPKEDLDFFLDEVLKNQTVFVAEHTNEVVGFAAFAEDWLNHLYVGPEHWRCGIGELLLSKVKTDSDFLQLWTFQRNVSARAFYRNSGFEEIEFTDGASNEEKTPDVRMTWRRRRARYNH